MVTLKNISKYFAAEKVLDDLVLDIPTGKLTTLIGPSGCGKSTLLKIIMGLESPDSGTLVWKDESQDKTTLERRRQIGYVIQEGGLFPHLTARQNVTLVADYLKLPKEHMIKKTHDLCELVQLESHLLDKYPVQLSGGQRQRISLMRALMLDPQLLLLDEPLAALDPMVRADLQQDLKQIFQQLQKTVILVTHDMGEAAFFADHIVLLRKGQIVQQGSALDLVNHPTNDFVTRFINAQRNPLDSLSGMK